MIVKVKFEELNEVKNTMLKDKNSFEIEVNRLLGAMEKLKTIWTGDDADMFYKNAYPYIKRMRVISEAIETLGNFIDGSAKQYVESERQNSSIMKSEVFSENEQLPEADIDY